MERDTPIIDRGSERVPGRGERGPVVPASADPAAASMLVTSLRRRPGHVVVTAPFSTTAARLFAMAEPQLGTSRIVRLSARLLVEGEVARAIVGVAQRGLPPPSAAAVAGVVADAKRQNRTIVLLIEDGDAVQLDRLERIREMLGRTPEMRMVVRLVLLGSRHLQRLLEASEAKPFVESLALHLSVSSPEPVTLARAEGKPAPRRVVAREPSRLRNEKLLVLAVGALLVTGVLLFPIEPTVYPPRPQANAPHATEVAPPAVGQPVPTPPVEDARTPDASAPAPGAPVEAPASDATQADVRTRFRPPATPGPAFQVGAFRDRTNAVRLARRLADDFDGVYVDQLGQGAASLHRVRVPAPGTVLGDAMVKRALAERGLAPVHVE